MEGTFEARVSGKRESSSGIYLTLLINPADYNADLATLRVGSTLSMGWVETVNVAVEEITDSPVAQRLEQAAYNRQAEGSNPSGATKGRKPFASLPLSQQAAIRSGDADFLHFIFDLPKGSMHITVEKDEDIGPEWIRKLCEVDSRAQIVEGTKAGNAWLELEARYQSWLTDRRYADVLK